MRDDGLFPLLDELARRHGHRAKVTVVVRADRLPGGAAVYTDDDLREAVAAIRRKAGMRFVADPERERRRAELLRRAAAALAAVERFQIHPTRHELPDVGAVAALIGKELAADGPEAG